MTIKNTCPEDAAELLEIYKYYVETTAVTFEKTAPSVEEFRERIKTYSARFPYIKAVDENGKALGFSFAHSLREREAYNWSVETTIYVRKDCRHQGIGAALYTELEKRLAEMGIKNMYACVAFTDDPDDPYLNSDSPVFHKKMGFESSGVFHKCGSKYGRWYDMCWLEKIIGEHTENPEKVRFYDMKE